MRILFVSNYFPPEVNAPATRLYEHATQWVADGHDVEVLTSVPNFPEGAVYDGYENRLTEEVTDGIAVTRVPMYVTPNEGVIRRALSYLSFMLSAWWFGRRQKGPPDVVVATSPQFFAALAGYAIARREGVPFVLEIRDLWPESIVAVGAMDRNLLIRLFERIERFLYRKAAHIVVVTEAFERALQDKGVPAEKISVIKNGVDIDGWDEPLDADRLAAIQKEHGLEGKFVVSYIGTIGMAHRVEVMLEAAQQCTDPDVVFMVVGAGARRDALEARQAELQLDNFRLVEKVPKRDVPYLMASTDASVVHLKASPLFKTVIPSKMFEAMITRTPIILGVEGEAKSILEAAGAGIAMPPEDADALVEAALTLKRNPARRRAMGENGREHVCSHYDRRILARRYAALLQRVTPDSAPSASADLNPVPA